MQDGERALRDQRPGRWLDPSSKGTEGAVVLVESRFLSSDTYTVTFDDAQIEKGRGQVFDVGRRA